MKKIVSALTIFLLSIAFFTSVHAQTVTQSVQNAGKAIVNIPGQVVGGVAGAIPGVIDDTIDGAVNAGVNWVNGKVNRIFNDIGGNGQLPSGDFRIENPDDFGNDIAQNSSARAYILQVLNFFLSFLGLLAVIIVIYAGFIYVTQGEDGKDKAKGMITYAVVGILVVLISFALVNTVIREAPVGGDDRASIESIQSIEMYAVQDRASPSGIIDGILEKQKGPQGLFSNLFASTFQTNAQQVIVDRDNIASLIVIKASDFIDTDEAIYVSLEEAKKGLTFGFGTASEVDWDMGDGFVQTTAPGKTFSYSYGIPGIYPVTAIGSDSLGRRILQVKAVVVGAQFAQFTLSPSEASVGSSISFDATRSSVEGVAGNIIRYSWSCSGGIGCFDDVEAPLFNAKFSFPGDYVIRLEIETSTGLIDSSAQLIRIRSSVPVAYFSTTPVLESDSIGSIAFNASESRSTFGNTEWLSYQWNVNGDQFETTEPFFEYAFAETGTYPVELVVVERRPGQELYSQVFKQDVVVESVLSVDFRFDPQNVYVGEGIQFEPVSTKAVRFLWEFEEGKTTRIENPVHVYTEPGKKSVSLTVQTGGNDQTITKIIPVLNRNRVTNFIQPFVNGEPVHVHGQSIVITKSDRLNLTPEAVDRFGRQADFNHRWFLDGIEMEKDMLLSALRNFGTYEIKLLSLQEGAPGQTGETSLTVEIQNRPPFIVSSRVLQDPSLPTGTFRVVTNAFDPEGSDLQYLVKAFFRGEQEVAQSGTLDDTLITLKNGDYIFEVDVSDGQGGVSTYRIPRSLTVQGVINHVPEVDFLIEPARFHFTTTNFVFRASAQDVDDDTLYYTWSIDGEVVQEGKSHLLRDISFDRPGVYNVSLRVDDWRGGVVHVDYDIDVKWDPNIKSSETNTDPEIDICTMTGSIVHQGSPVVFRSQAFDMDADFLSYTWEVENNPKYSTQSNIRHVFDRLGTTEVMLSVYDGFSRTEDRMSVQVVNSDVLLPTTGNRVCSESESVWETGVSDQLQKAIEIVPTQIRNTFLRRIGLSFLSEENQEDLAFMKSVEMLHKRGVIGLGSDVDINDILSERINRLEALLQRANSASVQTKIQTEIDQIKASPGAFAQEYVRNISPEENRLSPTLTKKVGATLFLQANIPPNFPKPLLISWEDGNGNQFYGQSASFTFDEAGFYLARLHISDELTESEDWIIIQVENK